MASGRESAVEIVGGTDGGQVGEGLREVSKMLAPVAELVAVQPEVVRVAEHLLEEEAGLLEVAQSPSEN